MDLLSLAILCGPMVDPTLTLRVIGVERAAVIPTSFMTTVRGRYTAGQILQAPRRIAEELLQMRHRIDVGLMQINYEVSFKPTRFALARALEPCTNIRLGTTILSANYAHALPHSHGSEDALHRALSNYNSGSEFVSLGYAERVLAGRVPKRLTPHLVR